MKLTIGSQRIASTGSSKAQSGPDVNHSANDPVVSYFHLAWLTIDLMTHVPALRELTGGVSQ